MHPSFCVSFSLPADCMWLYPVSFFLSLYFCVKKCQYVHQKASAFAHFQFQSVTELEPSPLLTISEPCRGVTCRHHAICVVTPEGLGICRCREKCFEDKDPVCGSDRKTYKNECELKRASCNRQITLTVEKRGPCGRY